MAVRRNGGSFPLQLFLVLEAEPGGEPADHVAPLAQRATQHIPLLVEAIDERAPGDGQLVSVEDDAQGARGADSGAEPARVDTAGADVGERAVAKGEKPGDVAQLRPAFGEGRPQAGDRLVAICKR